MTNCVSKLFMRRLGSFLVSVAALASSTIFCACAADGPHLVGSSESGHRGPTVDLDGRMVSGARAQLAPRAPEHVSDLSNSSRDQISRNARPIVDLALYPLYGEAGSKADINALTVSKDGSTAYIGGNDGTLFAAAIHKPVGKNNQGGRDSSLTVSKIFQSKHPILSLALSPDQRYLALSQYSAVYLIDLQKQAVTNTMTQVEGRILSLAWDPRQALLVMGRTSGEIFAWRLRDAPYAGQNSLAAIEQYGLAGSAPVVALAFHPSGRAFLAATQDGEISLWRLLRTESELGIRDESAEVDEDRKGSKQVQVGRASAPIEDLWFDASRQEVFVTSIDGKVARWRLRGLERQPDLMIGSDSASTFQGVSLSTASGNETGFLVAAGRGQRLKVFCRPVSTAARTELSGDVNVIPSDENRNSDEAEANQPRIVGGRLVLSQEGSDSAPRSGLDERSDGKAAILAETLTLKEPISKLRLGGTMLWAVQKKGNLLVFDARPTLSAITDRCPQI